jgi:ParB-like chromosome segregation protein Spo0J
LARRQGGALADRPAHSDARNARTHSPAEVDQIAASIQEWGWTNPMLVAEDHTLIAGHGRVLAARKLRISEVPVMVAIGWTEAQKKAYAIADKLALNAGWDEALLGLEIGELDSVGFDIGLLGFTDTEIMALGSTENAGLTDPDAVPDVPAEPVSRLGDVWLLGSHRLVCGDSTNAADVKKALGKVRPHLMVSDPPYGADYDPSWRNEANRWKGSNVKLGAKATGKVSNDDFADWTKAWELFPGDVAYVWHGALRGVEQAQGLEQAGFVIRSQIIWDKTRLVISRGNYHWQHELCWYAVRKGKTGHWNGSRTESTVWTIPNRKPPRPATARRSRSSA